MDSERLWMRNGLGRVHMQINDAGSVELLMIKLKRIYKSINDSLMRDRERGRPIIPLLIMLYKSAGGFYSSYKRIIFKWKHRELDSGQGDYC